MSCLAVAQVSGVDAVVNYTSPAEVCLQPALDAANLGSLSGLSFPGDYQSAQQLVMLWNLDVMGEGMQGVVRPCCTMPAVDFANELVEKAQVSGMQARLIQTSTIQMCNVLLGR
jgi:hypothetical protein